MRLHASPETEPVPELDCPGECNLRIARMARSNEGIVLVAGDDNFAPPGLRVPDKEVCAYVRSVMRMTTIELIWRGSCEQARRAAKSPLDFLGLLRHTPL